ncbi:hypothetical protein SAMN05421578_1073 [Paenibacillus macquariensis]|uniref:Uncharacterized protein n=1 Tax=Paenibacillus macquariensis TaxID=948756 RepID=A0ABY1K122_9BACL|nr:hypothetical protein SAMN05421578_1073 [Paenibacillus macquariensis]
MLNHIFLAETDTVLIRTEKPFLLDEFYSARIGGIPDESCF